MPEKKLDKQDFTQIQELEEKFKELRTGISEYEIELYYLEQAKREAQSKKENLLKSFDTLRQQEDELIERLRKKYGEGEINIQKGTFTPDTQQS